MQTWSLPAGIVLSIALAGLAAFASRAPSARLADWKDDPVWLDGQAEKATYRASRTLYGVARSYLATAYTDRELYDEARGVKSDSERGLAVFKHHWSERVPTEQYDYDFSTLTTTDAQSMQAVRLTVGTQEDCGASFKWAKREGGEFVWHDSVYFPGAGERSGRIPQAARVHFEDELPLLLRDFPFDAPAALELWLVRSQKDIRQVSFDPVAMVVRHVGRERASVPFGELDAHHLVLEQKDGAKRADLWFAADGRAPLLHVMVRYESVSGQSYALAAHERSAYWKR